MDNATSFSAAESQQNIHQTHPHKSSLTESFETNRLKLSPKIRITNTGLKFCSSALISVENINPHLASDYCLINITNICNFARLQRYSIPKSQNEPTKVG